MDLSIIVPIYNVENYLEECLNSIYPIKNIKKEIILVNDGSTDSSREIIEKYKKRYPEETVVIDKENGGLSSARNAGIMKAKGEYLSFLDSDDFIDTELFERFFLEGKKDDLDIIAGNGFYYEKEKPLKEFYRSEEIKKIGITKGINLDEVAMKTKCYRPEVVINLYKRNLLLENNIFFKEKITCEDELFTPIAYYKAEKTKYLDCSFYYYRQRQGSITSNKNFKYHHNLLKVINEILTYTEEEKIIKKHWNKRIINLYLLLVKESDIKNNAVHRKILSLKNYYFKDVIKLFLIKYFSIKNKNTEIKEGKNEKLNFCNKR